MRPFSLILLTLLMLGACAKPAWVRMPDVSMPDVSSWFNAENAVEVREMVRADACGTAGGESEVTVVPDLAALQAWAASRQVDLSTPGNQALPATPYAIVEFGQRPNSGYGLAVSRQAGMQNDVLLLKATFFEPQKGRWASTEPSSPCVLVSLPQREYRGVKLIDQTGKVRAATEDRHW